MRGPDRVADPAHRLVAGEHRIEQRVAAFAVANHRRQSGRHHDATGMRHREAMQIVDLENMGERRRDKSVGVRRRPFLCPGEHDAARCAIAPGQRVRQCIEHKERSGAAIGVDDRLAGDKIDKTFGEARHAANLSREPHPGIAALSAEWRTLAPPGRAQKGQGFVIDPMAD